MEDSRIDNDVTDNKVEEKSSKKPPLDLNRLNLQLTITIKIVTVIVLVFVAMIWFSRYQKTEHYGPSCKGHNSSFEKWIGKSGKVVSVHTDTLQKRKGTTTCYGTFELSSGAYKKWSGSLTEIEQDIVGWAKLN